MKYNYNVCLFSDCSNSLDYVYTNESFGIIVLYTETLQNLLDNKNINYDEVKLTLD